jgi:hypothetical protein
LAGASIALAALTLTRPDSPLFVALASAWVLFCGGKPTRASLELAVRLALPAFLCFLGQTTFRIWYHGDWVPNTARVKVSPSDHHFEGGMAYVGRFALSTLPLVLACAATVAAACTKRGRAWGVNTAGVMLVALPLAAWGWYVCWIGGDIFPAFRHGVPLLLAMTVITAEGVRVVAQRTPRAGILVAVLLALHTGVGWAVVENRMPITERWEWDSVEAGGMMRSAWGDRAPLLAVDAAGALPWASRLPTIDMLGLNDHYLPRNKPRQFGKRRIGHQLGDARYVLARKPDIVAIGYDLRRDAYEHGAADMQDTREFHDNYAWCRFVTPGPRRFAFGLWIRHTSGALAIVRGEDRIVVPAWFLSTETAPCRAEESGAIVTLLAAGDSAVSPELALAAGQWLVETDPPTAADSLRFGLVGADGAVVEVRVTGSPRFEVPGGVWRLSLEATEGSAALRSVTVRRAEGE